LLIFNLPQQGILKGEVSLYHWPPVWLVWIQLYDYWQFLFKQTNPNQSNRRSMVQWYFHFSIPCPQALSMCIVQSLWWHPGLGIACMAFPFRPIFLPVLKVIKRLIMGLVIWFCLLLPFKYFVPHFLYDFYFPVCIGMRHAVCDDRPLPPPHYLPQHLQPTHPFC